MSSEADERDLNVKNVLAEMKDISEEMLDLAYSAVLCRNSEVVAEVLRLEERMDALLYNLRVAAMLGARSVQDAIELAESCRLLLPLRKYQMRLATLRKPLFQ